MFSHVACIIGTTMHWKRRCQRYVSVGKKYNWISMQLRHLFCPMCFAEYWSICHTSRTYHSMICAFVTVSVPITVPTTTSAFLRVCTLHACATCAKQTVPCLNNSWLRMPNAKWLTWHHWSSNYISLVIIISTIIIIIAVADVVVDITLSTIFSMNGPHCNQLSSCTFKR